jgi:DNA-binding response OmpR family regulator
MRVLVAEDHQRLARSFAAGVRRFGMTVDVALDGDTARARLAEGRDDVVILDREVLGAHGDEGADDYPPEPFDFAEMVARVQVLGRRPGSAQPTAWATGM